MKLTLSDETSSSAGLVVLFSVFLDLKTFLIDWTNFNLSRMDSLPLSSEGYFSKSSYLAKSINSLVSLTKMIGGCSSSTLFLEFCPGKTLKKLGIKKYQNSEMVKKLVKVCLHSS